MTDAGSPIADFYPASFAIDMEGKRAEWEGVVLIPFIDEARLLAAEGRIPRGALSAEERARNALGDILIYSAAGAEAADAAAAGVHAWLSSDSFSIGHS
jgi:5'-3' exonuclease